MRNKKNHLYEPKIYIPIKDIDPLWEPTYASLPIETNLLSFTDAYRDLYNKNKLKRSHLLSNLTPIQKQTLRELKDNPIFYVTPTDKNLGPAIIEKEIYMNSLLKDHLLDTTNYKPVSKTEATKALNQAFKIMDQTVQEYKSSLDEVSKDYFTKAFLKSNYRIPHF